MASKYQKMVKFAKDNNEHNDCSVKAVAIACDVPYKVAHKALERAGRKPRKGVFPNQIQAAVESLGYGVAQWQVTAKTMSKLGADPELQKGHYMVFVRGHVAALKDGVIEDWTQGRRHRVNKVARVYPTHSRKLRKAFAAALFN